MGHKGEGATGSVVSAVGNAERQAEAEERIRTAVATLEAEGRPVSASAVPPLTETEIARA